MTEPTDAELWQLHMQMPGVHKDPIDFARAVLAKWGTPAGAGEVVAHRVMRKSLSGEWTSDARDWSDGPPSRALVDSICADNGRWRIDVAYAAPQPVAAPLTDSRAQAVNQADRPFIVRLAEDFAEECVTAGYVTTKAASYGRLMDEALSTQAQAGAVPLTDEQLWANDEIMSLNADLGWHMETIRMFTRAIERAHGIKGGQHGTE